MTQFIRKEFHVEDPDKTTTVRQDVPAPRPQSPSGGILYIIGLPGSGKSAVAAHLSSQLGCPALELPLDRPDQALDEILAAGPAVVEVPHKLLLGETFRQRLCATGRVLYLMASVESIAARQLADPAEQARLRERLGRQRTAYEPWFMQMLQLIVPADAPLEEVLDDALERVRL